MKTVYSNKLTLALGFALATFGAARVGHADDDAKENGWGKAGSLRLSLNPALVSGKRPGVPPALMPNPMIPAVPATPTVAGPIVEDYSRTQAWINFDYYGYFDKTRFDTLVGGEFTFGLGYFSAEAADPKRAKEPTEDYTKIHAKLDSAIDCAVIHWDGSMAGRVVIGAGFGGELGSSWYTDGGRVYPLLLSRFQLFLGETNALHFSAHWLPSTSDSRDVSNLRLEGSYALGGLDLGATLEHAIIKGGPESRLTTTSFGVLAGYIF